MAKPPPAYPVPAVRPIPPSIIAEAVVAELQSKPTDTTVRRIDERPPRFADWPDGLDPRLLAAFRRRGIERPYTHQARAIEHVLAGENVVVVTPTASGKTLCYNAPVLDDDPQGPLGARPLPLPDEGPRAGPARRAPRPHRRHRRGHPHLHLRRRHPRRRPPRGPQRRPHRPHQPRHAAHRHPAPPHEVGAALRKPRIRRHRRAPHVPGRLRQPRRERAPAAAAHLPVLRRDPDLHPLLGHDRQPGRARARPSSATTSSLSTTTAPPPASASSSSTTRRSSTANSASASPPSRRRAISPRGSSAPASRRSSSRRAACASSSCSPTCANRCATSPATRERVAGYRGGYLPNERRSIEHGLRDGSVRGVVATNALELGIDIGGLGASVVIGYPGAARQPLAAVRPRRPHPRGRHLRPRRLIEPARPVRRRPSRLRLRRQRRARPDRPRQPLHPRQPPEVRRLRAAVQPGRSVRRAHRRAARHPRTRKASSSAPATATTG